MIFFFFIVELPWCSVDDETSWLVRFLITFILAPLKNYFFSTSDRKFLWLSTMPRACFYIKLVTVTHRLSFSFYSLCQINCEFFWVLYHQPEQDSYSCCFVSSPHWSIHCASTIGGPDIHYDISCMYTQDCNPARRYWLYFFHVVHRPRKEPGMQFVINIVESFIEFNFSDFSFIGMKFTRYFQMYYLLIRFFISQNILV